MDERGVELAVIGVDAYVDLTCPWCYAGHASLARAAREVVGAGARVRVRWQPRLLFPALSAPGSLTPCMATEAVAAAVARAGAGLLCAERGLLPSVLAQTVLRLTRGTSAHEPLGEALLCGYHERGLPLHEPKALTEAAVSAGVDPAAAAALVAAAATREAQAATLAEDAASGVSRVPFYRVRSATGDGPTLEYEGGDDPDLPAEALAIVLGRMRARGHWR
mmetsp:Transcript_1508/g.5560  ORF Transcript_1508/g.5560 Transcript_1508/m.5560 type:complete len:221 (-) Transcript_1508:1085-1747(-)